jgi:Protein of unknown function (DUF2442)
MNETEQVIGMPLPRLAFVACVNGAYEIAVRWVAGLVDLVDLAPLILTHKLYTRLRDNPDLLRTVHLIEGGSAIAWGTGDIDMAATSIERLVEDGCRQRPAGVR